MAALVVVLGKAKGEGESVERRLFITAERRHVLVIAFLWMGVSYYC